MPVRQGSRQIPAQCLHGEAGDHTDDPGAIWPGMVRVAIREWVKAP